MYVANERLTKEDAEKVIDAGEADAVAFGKPFIANPDLPKRFAMNAPLNPLDSSSFYRGGSLGYVDYPTLEQLSADATT